jgi:hypothetical protein
MVVRGGAGQGGVGKSREGRGRVEQGRAEQGGVGRDIVTGRKREMLVGWCRIAKGDLSMRGGFDAN